MCVWIKIYFGEENENDPTLIEYPTKELMEAYLKGVSDGFGWVSHVGVVESSHPEFIGRGAS